MKAIVASLLDRLARRAFRAGAPALNIAEVARLKATLDSADYYETNLLRAKEIGSKLDLLSLATQIAPADGLILEFGVASGFTISHLARAAGDRAVYGFDSFEGLPEDWWSTARKGTFAQAAPDVPPNVRLVTGLFCDSLPTFAREHPEPVALMHVDCDLYSSTKSVLNALGAQLVPGSVIVFDEYWNYPGWRQHEHRAFQELVASRGLRYRYEAFVPTGCQVCVVIE